MTEDQIFQGMVEKIPRKSITIMIGFVQRVKTLIFRGEKDVISVQPEETAILELKEIKNGEMEIDPKGQEEVEKIADLKDRNGEEETIDLKGQEEVEKIADPKDREEIIVNLTIIKNLILKKQNLGHLKGFVVNLELILKIEN